MAYCATLSLGGHSDWRLPSYIEIVSLFDYGNAGVDFNATYFPTLGQGSDGSLPYWSSTPSASSSSLAWVLDGYANSYASNISQMEYVVCVR